MKSFAIQKIPLFRNLPEHELVYLAETLEEIALPEGELIFNEGESGGDFLIILSGELEAIKGYNTPAERIVAVRQAGDHVGEMSLLRPGKPRSATVRARSDARLLRLTRSDFNRLLVRQPILAYEMTRTLSDRLDQSDTDTVHDLHEINRHLQEVYTDLNAARAQIIEKEKLEHELSVARRIQESILPQTMPHYAGFAFDAVMIPMRAIGGDLFDFVEIDATHLGVAVADVADKGIPAAIFMALTRSLLRAEALRSISPETVLRNVNRVLVDLNTSDMFVTVIYGVLDLATGIFEYARAGHPAPLILKAQQLLAPTPRSAQPLGLFNEFDIDVGQIQLESGDTLLLYSDGVTEAMNADFEEFGSMAFTASILEIGNTTRYPSCAALLQKLDEFRGQALQNDDITLAAVYVY
jgi:serine phosphatase RsbU (regulator of sigma subunit)